MGRKRLFTIKSLALLIFVLLPGSTFLSAQQKSETLYRRLGGYDGIAAVVDDLVARMGTDPQLARFSAGFSRDSRRRRRQLLVDQLCEATGGPCYYIGRDMKTVHQGLAITESEWNAVVKHLSAALDKNHAGQKEKEELLAIVAGTKADIVGSSPRAAGTAGMNQ